MSPRRLLVLASVAALLSLPARAHEVGMVQVEVTFQTGGSYVVDLVVDNEHLPPPTAGMTSASDVLDALRDSSVLRFDGKPVPHGTAELTGSVAGKPGLTRLRLIGRTPSRVSQFSFSNSAISGYFVLRLHNEGQSAAVTQWLEGGQPSSPFPLDRTVVPPSGWQTAWLYLGLGYTHILPHGIDHVLFVLCMFLLAVELRPVVWQVTAFTLAHTISLALSVYGVIALPAGIVEPLIALSIVWVAIENVSTSRLRAWRPLVVFSFGLLHGLGFAGALREIGLPRSEFLPALLGFNLGVEAGQLSVILAAFLVVGLPLRGKDWYRRRVVVPGSLAIAAVGSFWSIQRLLAA